MREIIASSLIEEENGEKYRFVLLQNIKMNPLYYLLFIISTLCANRAWAQPFCIKDVRVGDSTINYANPEIAPTGNYMLWIEIDTANGFSGRVWHCGLDPRTGDLIPADGKGFNAFNSNVYGRPADWGVDSIGPYYVGLNTLGQWVWVRPTRPTSGISTILSIPPDTRRRVIYPSQLPDTNKRFITYILNENQPGGANNPANSTFDLRFLDLDDPTSEISIETQTRTFPAAVGMDVLVPRWIKGTPYLTYGFYDSDNFVQVKEFDAFNPGSPGLPVTTDQTIKADGYPVNNPFNGKQYIISGLNGTDSAIVYRRDTFGQEFTPVENIIPNSIHLTDPALNQSHEPFFFKGQLYTAFQVNEDGGSFINTTLNEPGEIWITNIDSIRQTMWLISDFDSTLNVSEPEPFTGDNKIFVFYSANTIDPDNAPLNRIFQLRRCETPMNDIISYIDEKVEKRIKVFPNPTSGLINIEGGNDNIDVRLFGVNGKLLVHETNPRQIDLSPLPDGSYFLVLSADGFRIIEKIVKN